MDKVKVLFEKAHEAVAAHEHGTAIAGQNAPEFEVLFADLLNFIAANFVVPEQERDQVRGILTQEAASGGKPLPEVADDVQPLVALRFIMREKKVGIHAYREAAAKNAWVDFTQRYKPVLVNLHNSGPKH